MEEKISFSKDNYYLLLNSENGLISSNSPNKIFKIKPSSQIFILCENKTKLNQNLTIFTNTSNDKKEISH